MIIKDNNPKNSKHWLQNKINEQTDDVKLIVENGKVKELIIDDKKEHPKLRTGTTERLAECMRTYEVELTKGDIPHIW